MAKSDVRVGMLGAGFIGQMHSLACRNAGFSRREPAVMADLVLLADKNEQLASDVARRYEWAATTTQWAELFEFDLDLFINAGPNDLHHEPSVAAAEAGIPVFCEKPLGSTAEDAYRLWKAVESTGVMHRCGFMHRFIPAIQLARRMVEDGELGEVRHLRSTFLLNMLDPNGEVTWRFDPARAGAGAMGDLGSHHLDLARFIVSEVVTVGAITQTWTTDPLGKIAEVNDDAFVAIALLDNGATATFEASRTAAAHDLTGRIEIDGTRASISWSMERLNELVIRVPGKGPRVQSVTRPRHPFDEFWLPSGLQGSHPLGWNECFAHQAYDVLGLASGKLKESAAATFEDGYRVAEIVDALARSAESGGLVDVSFRS